MKIEMLKMPGGMLTPASDMELEKLNKFKSGEQYTVEIKRTRNPRFHRKTFAFMQFCFSYWKGDREFQSEAKQFNTFRNHLTVIAGHYDQLVNIHGEIRIEAKSLSYANMNAEEFEELYNSLILAAMKTIFHTTDEETYNKLISFF